MSPSYSYNAAPVVVSMKGVPMEYLHCSFTLSFGDVLAPISSTSWLQGSDRHGVHSNLQGWLAAQGRECWKPAAVPNEHPAECVSPRELDGEWTQPEPSSVSTELPRGPLGWEDP